MISASRALHCTVLAVFCLMPLAGCAKAPDTNPNDPTTVEEKFKKKIEAARVTQENFAKIKLGMKKSEVEAILGSGTLDESTKLQGFSGRVTVWKDGNDIIYIGFTDEKVADMQAQFAIEPAPARTPGSNPRLPED